MKRPVCEKTAGFTWTGDKTNTEIAILNLTPILDKILDCRNKFDTTYKQNVS